MKRAGSKGADAQGPIQRFFRMGSDPENPSWVNRSITVTNIAAAVGLAVQFSFAAIYLSLDVVALLPAILVILVTSLALLSVFWLNHRKRHLAAGVAMNLFVALPVFLNARLFFGHEAGYHFLLILCILLPAISITARRWWIPLALAVLDFVFFLSIYNQIPLVDLSGTIPPRLLADLNDFSQLFTIVGIVATVTLYQIAMAQNERTLESKSERLRSSLDQVSQMANQDGLTGILNRRHLEELLRAEIARSERYGTPLSMVMFDLDHFKKLNDTYGHMAGDQVLVRTASMVRDLVRATDYVARWGGEEFVVVLPHTDLDGAMVMAEKLRKAMNETFASDRPVTGSFGVVEREKGESFDDFFGRVDEALYVAKNAGRDRVAAVVEPSAKPRPLASIAWKEEWESGDDRIDRQHRKLLRLANDLLSVSLTTGESRKALALLDDLMKEIVHHFSYEEGVLQQIRFHGLDAHRAAHRLLVEHALALKDAVLRGERRPIAVFVFVLEEVVAGHMMHDDVRYFEPLRVADAEVE